MGVEVRNLEVSICDGMWPSLPYCLLLERLLLDFCGNKPSRHCMRSALDFAFSISTSNPSGGCGPISSVAVIRPNLIGHYLAGPVF